MIEVNLHEVTPQIIKPDKILIPDINCLTGVNLPKEIDLRKSDGVLKLLACFVDEEKSRNNSYRGVIIHGSVAHRTANNGSDIDGVHVIRTTSSKELSEALFPIRYRLKVIFEECYDIPIQDSRNVIDLSEQGYPNRIIYSAEELDKYSQAIGLSSEEEKLIDELTGYRNRAPYVGKRTFKQKSKETGVHVFKYPTDSVLPWYAEYGLLERIYKD